MTPIQHLWWEQARSDYDVLMLMRNAGSPPCQQLHYLQMVTEKVGKAYLWRNDVSPGTSHAAFVSFLKSQADRPRQEAIRVASLLGFIHMKNYRAWLRKAIPLAYALQGMAPALAGDGPNPEYPWPPKLPTECPAHIQFAIWTELTVAPNGRNLLRVIDRSINAFPQIA